MKKLLLITHNQFGYQISSFYYAHYLKQQFDVNYLSFNEGKEVVAQEGLNVSYVEKKGNLIMAYLKLAFSCIKHIKNEKPDCIIAKYFPACSLIPVLTLKKIILDIRTASVSTSVANNIFRDVLLRFESLFFSTVIILSESLRKRLFLHFAKVVPLGAQPKGFSHKQFNGLELLYVGTLNNRDVEKTIDGLKIFIENNPQIPIHYTIIGAGNNYFTNKVDNAIQKNNLVSTISLTGRIPHTRLTEYFTKANVGIAFVPKTKYFDKQPPSKTYEYLMAGMPVIATSTFENSKIITTENGLLTNDTSESFAVALKFLWEKRNFWNSETIAKTVSEYNWENIIHNTLLSIINGKQ